MQAQAQTKWAQAQAQQAQAQTKWAQAQAQQAQAQWAKDMYGHVDTPPAVVERMLECLPDECWAAGGGGGGGRWLDCGAGLGAIGGRILERLPCEAACEAARVDMVEINPSAAAVMRARFAGDGRARVVEADFLAADEAADPTYDVVVANPPYNVGGAIKTPTNTSVHKSLDGRVVWREFVRRSVGMLRAGGHAVFLVPSCWLRGGEVYRLLLVENDGLGIECMSNTQTNSAFGQLAQTPTCIVHVRRRAHAPAEPRHEALRMYDRASDSWVEVPRAHVAKERPLPTDNARLVLKLARAAAAERGPTLAPLVTKTTLMKKRNRQTPPSPVATAATPHANVKTCVLARSASNRRRKKRPTAVLEYTAEPTKFQADGRPQLILAHKMYGLPLLDASGAYGVTNADSYVVRAPDDDLAGLARIQCLLCSPLALLVFESFRYRMRFLEREAFDVLPDPRHAAAATEALEALDATDAAAVEAFARRLQFAPVPPSIAQTKDQQLLK